ncbi:MAG: GNAT family N-acetyltransferase [archaeon]|nr:GNAT family N-acetyltransferase [archaeon]
MAGSGGGDEDLVHLLGVYKVALLWYYSRLSGIAYPLPPGPSPHSASFFDSTTICPYLNGVFVEGRRGVSSEALLQLADQFLPATCQQPFYSVQFAAACDPVARTLRNDGLRAGVEGLGASGRWEIEPLQIMLHPLDPLPALREGLECVEILPPGHPPEQSTHFPLFEAYERICADAFAYTYRPDIAQAHFAMGDTSLPEVRYVRNVIRRTSDNAFIGVGAYLWAPHLPVGYISEIAVLSSCQRQGVGVFVISSILHSMARRGVARAVLSSTEAGQALYLKTGFSVDPSVLSFMISNR